MDSRPAPRPDSAAARRGRGWLGGLVAIEPGERAGVLWAAALFFLLLASYYLVRPARESLGVSRGPDALKWLFSATFVATLAAVAGYTWLVSRLSRGRLLRLVYQTAAASLVTFALLLLATSGDLRVVVGYAFFVWLSVYNHFGLGAVFWALMADLHTPAQGKRLFGAIAAGGTAGALAGSAAARALSGLGVPSMLTVAAAVLGFAVWCLSRLLHRLPVQEPTPTATVPVASIADAFRGAEQMRRSRFLAGIAAFTVCDIVTSTYLYSAQGGLARSLLPAEEARTSFFATIDLAANALILVLEVAVVGRLMTRLGLGLVLASLPVLSAAGLWTLAAAPTLAVLGSVQVLRRGIEFGLAKPAREVLFTAVSRREKYEAKAFIDTAVNRGADVAVLWALALVGGATFAQAALWTLPLALGWIWLARRLAAAFHRRTSGLPVAK